ncbi:MAG: hypothetical protein LBE74_01835 [Treponema sp.]|nr:hypothetical protein [Treponema sp.]
MAFSERAVQTFRTASFSAAFPVLDEDVFGTPSALFVRNTARTTTVMVVGVCVCDHRLTTRKSVRHLWWRCQTPKTLAFTE